MTEAKPAPCGQQEKHDYWEALGYPCTRCLSDAILSLIQAAAATKKQAELRTADTNIVEAKKR